MVYYAGSNLVSKGSLFLHLWTGEYDLTFNEVLARTIASQICANQGDEFGLVEAFAHVCHFLHDNPDRLSLRSKATAPSLMLTSSGLQLLAKTYFTAYRKSDLPVIPGTVPDTIVSVVMMEAFGYSQRDVDRIKIEHQLAMSAENCVGALLERYLDSVLRPYGWYWCCGSFVKAVDFIRHDHGMNWLTLQIKNRDNSENSSSSAIRNGTPIQKWFRSFSRTGATNWSNLPPLMHGYNLSEQGFTEYVRAYLLKERQRTQQAP